MAVKARATVTISRIIDISAITRYYILQSSTATAPAKPTTNPPSKNLATAQDVYNSDAYLETVYDGKTCIRMTSGKEHQSRPVRFKEKTQYTVSFDAKTVINSPSATANNIAFCFFYTDGSRSVVYSGKTDIKWTHKTLTSDKGKTVKSVGVYPLEYRLYTYIDVDSFQLEEGTVATSYTKVSWRETEPSYSSGSTDTLYYVDCTEFTNGTFKYSEVSKSSSYEAAKEAYNKAQNAQNTANSAKDYTDKMKTQHGYQYKYDITINGDAGTYYPVVLRGGDQNVMREILVARGYSEKAPEEWNGHQTAHGISLLLKMKCNYGGWGGANYSWWIHDFEEMYGNVFASAGWCMSYMGFYIFLRGGGDTGALYHIYSDQPLNVTFMNGTSPAVYYNSDRIGWSGGTSDNPTYSWNAPAPRIYTDAIKNEINNKRYINLASDAHSRVISAETKIEQNKDAIALRATKTEMAEYIASRKENLVTNGSASLGDNTNFGAFKYDPVNPYYSNGSFRMVSKYEIQGTDEYIPVDVNQRYDLSYMIKSSSGTAIYYDFLDMYDADKNVILHEHVHWMDGSTTTLAKELKAGDTTVALTSVSGFKVNAPGSNRKGLIFWCWKNTKGYQYPVETYSRYVALDLWADSTSINTSTNIITLKKAWSGNTFPAGTSVSQTNGSGVFSYINSNYTLGTPNVWVQKTGSVKNAVPQNPPETFREGTAFVRVRWLINYAATADVTTWITNVNLTCNASSNDVNGIRDDLEDQGKNLNTRIDEAYASLETNAKSINASVEKLQTTFEKNADSTDKAISELQEKVNLQLTEDAVNIQIDKKLQNGVNRVETSTGFKFDENGINVSKTGANTSTQITENGMSVLDVNETDPEQKTVLKADKDGVDAKNLRASTYLVIGGRSRFENYGAYRTGCFWIGPSSGLNYPVQNATVLAEELKAENTELKQSLQDIKDGLDNIT